MRDSSLKNRLYHLASIPSVASLLVTVLFYIICLGLLHPGYAINDDLQIISIVSGYPAGNPAPFLIFSNVLLGLVLKPLYALHTPLNWEMLLFSAINLLSLWALLDTLFAGSIRIFYKLIGAIIVLACTEYYVLNITFTSTATLACFAGTCKILAGTKSSTTLQKTSILCGISLVIISSLIRIQMLALSLAATLPVVIFFTRSLDIRRLIAAFILTGMLIFGGFAFDKLYVRADPAWHTYYFYNQTAQQLQDAHRLENLHTQIKRIGWSGNDQELFARSFFPDASIYSLDRIRYLVEHVPGTSQDIVGPIITLLRNLVTRPPIPFLFFIASVWLFLPIWALPLRTSVVLVTVVLLCLAENLVLVWGYKDPQYVFLPSLANASIFSVLILDWLDIGKLKLSHSFPLSGLARIITFGSILTLGLAVGLILSQSITTSQNNMNKQNAYRLILADLDRLRSEGKISQNSLIIAPTHGLPMEWSNPFVLGFPSVPYFATGWITFSPTYEHVLQAFAIDSLPDALYQKSNIYLMTRTNFTVFLARYYQEHESINVAFQTVYNVPNTYHFSGFDDIHLFKVIKTK